MTHSTDLITAYLLDGAGKAQKIGWDEINSWKPKDGILWTHLNYTSKTAAQWLVKDSGVDKINAKSMLVAETRPRTVMTAENLLVFLRGVNLNPGKDPEDMISIRVWLDKNRVITTARHKLLSIEDIERALSLGQGPSTTAEFLTTLNDRLLDHMSDAIETLEEEVDALEEAVLTTESYFLRPKIADARRECTTIRRYLAPQKEALSRLYREESPLLTAVDRARTRESSDRIIRYIEDLDSARERASITQEELTSRLSEQMDHRMYILSVVAVIFLPLTFITGLLGINVGGIPGTNYKWAFLWVCIGMVLILGLTFWWSHRKKWI
jgi:zinc transporter